MATTRSFQEMLNEYMPYSLLKEEFIKRDYLISKIDKKNDWKGGATGASTGGAKLIVPFQGAYASSVRFGSLTAEGDISEDVYVRGEINNCPEIWGSLKFNHRDLMEHNGKVNEQSFLKLLPGAIEDFMDQMKFSVSQAILTGSHFDVVNAVGDTILANGTAAGVLAVNHVGYYFVGQKIEIAYDAAPVLFKTRFVIDVNPSAGTITVSASDPSLGAAPASNENDVLLADVPLISLSKFGNLIVNRIERFTLNQKLQIADAVVASASVYVIGIEVNTNNLILSATRGGVAVDLSARLMANSPKLYLDDAQANGMTNLRSVLLSEGNGGTSQLYGKTKTSYPFLQALNFDGSTITSSNIHQKIFSYMATVSQKGKGKPTTAIMSYKHLGEIMALVETSKSPYKVDATTTKASLYGWTSLQIHGPTGMVECVGVQEMDDDIIFLMDWRGIAFHSNGWFQKRTAPDGKQYFEVRNPSGYSYILDIGLFGDLVVSRPSYSGIIHSIP